MTFCHDRITGARSGSILRFKALDLPKIATLQRDGRGIDTVCSPHWHGHSTSTSSQIVRILPRADL